MKNIGFILQFSDRTEERLTDGGLESWTAGNLNYWTKFVSGTSTVNEETINKRPGSTGLKCCRIDIDAGSNTAYIYQDITLIKGAFYVLKLWYKITGDNSANPEVLLYDTGSNVWLHGDGTWQDNSTGLLKLSNQSAWGMYEFRFRAHPTYTNYRLRLVRENTLVNCSIYIDDVQLVLDSTFVSFEDIIINSAQYLPHVLSPVSISSNAAIHGEFESSGFDIELSDPAGNYRSILNTYGVQAIGGIVVAVDTAGAVICERIITNISYETGKVRINTDDGFEELTSSQRMPVITRNIWSGAAESSIGNVINHFIGSFLASSSAQKGKENYIKAWRVQNRVGGSVDGKYLIGVTYPGYNILRFNTVAPPPALADFQYCIDPAGNDITQNCTLQTHFSNGTKYDYLLYKNSFVDVAYILVSFRYDVVLPENLLRLVDNWFMKKFKIDFDSLLACNLNFAYRHYQIIGYTYDASEGYYYNEFPENHLLIDADTSILEILKKYCQTYGLSFYITNDKKIKFYVQDFEKTAISTETKEIQPGISGQFTITNYSEDYENLVNNMNFTWGYSGGSYNRGEDFSQMESQIRYEAEKFENIEALTFSDIYPNSDEFAWNTAKQFMLEGFTPTAWLNVTFPDISTVIDIAGTIIDDVLIPFKILKFSHPVFKSTTARYLQVRRITRIYPGNSANVDMIDVTYTRDFDFEALAVLQSNRENGAIEFYDWAPRAYTFFTNSNVIHSSTKKLFGKSSISFNGISSYLQFNDMRRDFRFEIFRALGTNFNAASVEISFWVYFNVSGTGEVIVGSRYDGSNYWNIRKTAADKIAVVLFTGGVQRFQMLSPAAISIGAWHHIIFYRTDVAAGLYIDGVQTNYDATVLDYYFSVYPFVPVIIGQQAATNYLNGYLQSWRPAMNGVYDSARATGWFNLNPNVGLTDTYTVPTGLISSTFQKYWMPKVEG